MVNLQLAKEVKQPTRHRGWGVRHTQALISFFGLTVAYVIRMDLAVAVVGMTTSQNYSVDLSPEKKALVLSSFFFGYGFLQVASGAFGRRGYAVKLFAFGNLMAGALSLTIPFAATHFGFVGLCILRFCIGLVQGNIYPNLNNVMANWAIPQERDSIMCIVQAGPSVGSLLAMVVSGYLGHYFDWPSIFYASGSLGLIWGIIHATVGKEGPESCTYLTEDERNYMKQSFRAEDKEVQEKRAEVPWRQILTSGPVIAITITSWCSTWASKTITTLIPSYVNGVLGFNLGHNGLISALPYLFAFPTNAAFALTARILKAKAKVPESFLRPFWNSLAMYGNAAALLTLAFAPVTQTFAVILLVISTSVNVAICLGHIINNLDLSPNFAGVIMSITNTTANTAAILGPLISTYLIKDDSNVYQWRIVFILSAVIAFIGNTVFIFFGTVKKQPWDEGKKPTSQPV